MGKQKATVRPDLRVAAGSYPPTPEPEAHVHVHMLHGTWHMENGHAASALTSGVFFFPTAVRGPLSLFFFHGCKYQNACTEHP